jgi:hypothetical protein
MIENSRRKSLAQSTRTILLAALVAGTTFAGISQVHATVDMKNANYTESWIDIQITGSGYALRVQRTYNSRSVFNGMFGFGWCSDFETSITKNPEGHLKLQECGAGQEITFRPQGAGGNTLSKTVDSIIAYYRKTNPNSGESSITILRDQLLNNSNLRANWAKQAGVATPTAPKGSVFVSDNLEVEKIEFDGSQYSRTLADGTVQKFNSAGRLISLALQLQRRSAKRGRRQHR